jgi:aminotransferase in exopolysaccharide biosynthesis
MYDNVIYFIRSLYPDQELIPLHEPKFLGNEKKYLIDCIDSTFVSSVGAYVDRFEEMLCEITGAKHAVATVNGTCALHIALLLINCRPGDEVITQPFTFIATANAISYCNAEPIFLDVDRKTLGLDYKALENFLKDNANIKNDTCYNRSTGKRISACVPMHTFGHPCKVDKIVDICEDYQIAVVEDSAESLGSKYKGKHTGTIGKIGVFSFNGNKTVTCGGGGAIVTDNEKIAKTAKHLTTTAKVSHPYEYTHDAIGYNYRMPNLNAALACAQLEQLERFIDNKRELAKKYADFFKETKIKFITETEEARSNYWLNTIVLSDINARNEFLEATHAAGLMTRPAWELLNTLDMYKYCKTDDLKNAQWFVERVVNIPSSVQL